MELKFLRWLGHPQCQGLVALIAASFTTCQKLFGLFTQTETTAHWACNGQVSARADACDMMRQAPGPSSGMRTLCQGDSRANADASDGCHACRAVDSRYLTVRYRVSRRGPSHGSQGCSQTCRGMLSAWGCHSSTALLICIRKAHCGAAK